MTQYKVEITIPEQAIKHMQWLKIPVENYIPLYKQFIEDTIGFTAGWWAEDLFMNWTHESDNIVDFQAKELES